MLAPINVFFLLAGLTLLVWLLAALGGQAALQKGLPVISLTDGIGPPVSVAVDLPNNLTAGVIFVQEPGFYLSAAEWLIVVKTPKLDDFSSALAALQTKVTALYNSGVKTAIMTEIDLLLNGIAHMTLEIKNFEQSARRDRRAAPPAPTFKP